MSRIVVIGSLNEDRVFTLGRFPKPGETLSCSTFETYSGGKGANQALAAARSDGDVAMIGCVGDDRFGKTIIRELASEGIDTSGINFITDNVSGSALVFVNDDGENSIVVCTGSNGELTPERVCHHTKLISDAEFLLLQNEVPLESSVQALSIASENGTRVVWNPAPAIGTSISMFGDPSKIDIFTPNQSEAELLTGIPVRCISGARAASQVLHEKGLRNVIITMGREGVWFSENGNGLLIEGFPVKPIDTTGAGDTFNGALLAELSNGRTMHAAIRFAQGAAALAVTRKGAQTSVPVNVEVNSFIARACL